MKFKLTTLTIILFFAMSTCTFADTLKTIAYNDPVLINWENIIDEYPPMLYGDVIYLPLTWQITQALGL
ncbi:hypothetical protein KHM83_19365 [Fusibacter paucivorans]|uniref:Uncharacterized protein n=1 Tax=Fusibacter paucivorans TaxID=76009 RepID=A0ABS5PW39_9FIRM|nr:hypothetical protein [Fusibacter paucivorans]MBS7528831.1 hypothetical protein [Fusibacter paucivorans]